MDAPRLRLAHSPDSDDLVMWWPLTGMRGPDGTPVAGELGSPRVDRRGLSFELLSADVERLNRLVIREAEGSGETGPGADRFDITAVSCAAYPAIRAGWRITSCGGSFGDGYGPKVVVPEGSAIRGVEDLLGKRVAVPGRRTTAFLALSLLLREAGGGAGGVPHEPASEAPLEVVELPFERVTGEVVEGRADAGLLIHEAQLTFAELGLRQVVDLGAWWTGRTGLPLPLGLNVIRRDLDERFGRGTVERASAVLIDSVRYAVEHAEESREYLLLHANDRPEWRDAGLVERYLSMYVSRMSLEMGERGRAAIGRLLAEGARAGLCPPAGEIDVV